MVIFFFIQRKMRNPAFRERAPTRSSNFDRVSRHAVARPLNATLIVPPRVARISHFVFPVATSESDGSVDGLRRIPAVDSPAGIHRRKIYSF